MPRLNSEERARVLAMLECGRTQEQVARRFNVLRSTIPRLVRRVRVTGTFADRPRSGRPRVTSVRQDNFVRQHHLRDRFVTAEWTSRVVVSNRGRPISRYTVRRRLRERGITCRTPYRGFVLTLLHCHQRLIWACNHRGQHWQNVVFSGESCFNLWNADGRIRVYRRRLECYVDNCVIENNLRGWSYGLGSDKLQV